MDVHCGEDNEADAGEGKAECDKRETESGVVGCECEDEEHCCARNVGCHGVEVGLDRGITESLDDNREEERYGLQWHTETDLDSKNDPAGRVLENGHGRSEVELLSDDGGRVDLDSVECQLLLLGGQKLGALCIPGQIPESKEGEQNCAAAFNDEKVSPIGNAPRFDLENTIGQETTKCRCD